MRTIARAFPLLAAACLAALPAHAQLPDSAGAQSVRIDPCTGKPYAPRGSAANRADPQPGTPSTGGTPSGMTHSGAAHSTATPSGATAPGMTSSATASPGAASSGTATSATSSGATASGAQTSGATPSASGSPQGGPGSAFSAGGREADPEDARRYREALRLGRGATREQVRLGPAASVSVPTALSAWTRARCSSASRTRAARATRS